METGPCDIVVVGSCMIDLVSFTPRLPQPGETLHGDKFVICFGGKGANQCVAAARLGSKTALVARLGDDNFGHDYMQNFKKNGISTEFVHLTKGVSSGIATICVESSGQNSIVIVAGANKSLCAKDIDKAEKLISKAQIVVCQLETEVSATLYALKLAKKHGVTTILNTAPAYENLPDEIFKVSDILCLNETETEIVTKLTISSMGDARTAGEELLKRGCATVVITMGKQGAFAIGKDCPDGGVEVAARLVKPVDSTGAGDAFVGALAHYLSRKNGLSMKEVLRRCCEIGTSSVLKEGTQPSFPYKADLDPELFN